MQQRYQNFTDSFHIIDFNMTGLLPTSNFNKAEECLISGNYLGPKQAAISKFTNSAHTIEFNMIDLLSIPLYPI